MGPTPAVATRGTGKPRRLWHPAADGPVLGPAGGHRLWGHRPCHVFPAPGSHGPGPGHVDLVPVLVRARSRVRRRAGDDGVARWLACPASGPAAGSGTLL